LIKIIQVLLDFYVIVNLVYFVFVYYWLKKSSICNWLSNQTWNEQNSQNDRKFIGDFDYSLSKTSKVIQVYSICTDHKGESLKTQRTAKAGPNNLKFNICHQWNMINLFLDELPTRKSKKKTTLTHYLMIWGEIYTEKTCLRKRSW
jgi:hypothetical protein